MDPFSLAVGISALVALTAQTLQLAKSYFHGVRHAPKAAAALAHELNILRTNLVHLDEFLRGEGAKGQSFSDTSVLVSGTDACRAKLRVLYNKLIAVKEESRVRRAVWPLSEKEHREAVQELRTFTQWIRFALTVDGCALLSKTSEDVVHILGKQLESFQLLREIDSRTVSIEDSIKEHTEMLQDDRAVRSREKILNWISTFEHERKHHGIRMPRVKGTGEWLLNSNELQRWRDDLHAPNVLWCHGIQGSGKSVLTSLVIDRLRDDFAGQNVAIAFVYFDYRDQDYQSPEYMFASLLKQVALMKPAIPKFIVGIYGKLRDQRKQPQLQDLEKTLLLTCQEFDLVFIAIDALDECDESRYRRTFIQTLTGLQQEPKIRLLITSRFYPQDIRGAFGWAPQITVEANDSDLMRYLSYELENGRAADIIDESFKLEIIDRIASGAQKMFLLPALQIQTVMNEPTPGEMEEALEAMPRNLHEAFQETMARIQRQPDGRKRLGIRTLMWISHARSSLTVAELSEALAIRSGQTCLNARYRPSQKLMVECCLGLVTADDESSSIRLVHYSIQEYFRERQKDIFPSGEEEIAEMCLTYLFFDSFAQGCCETEADILVRMKEHSFLAYAAFHWGYHVSNSQKCDRVDKMVSAFLRSQPRRSFSTQIRQFARGYREEYWAPDEVNSVSGLHVASSFGLQKVAHEMLQSPEVDVDAATYIGTTALMRAAAAGQRELVQMLLSHAADPKKVNWYGTSLHCAAEAGQCSPIKELLKTGMDVDFRDAFGRTALHCAANMAHTAAVQLLLDNGADPNARDADGKSLGHYAAEGGHERIMLLLLQSQIDIEARTRRGMTMLHYAAIGDHTRIVSTLLARGADINARREDGFTALHFAARWGAEETVLVLVRAGADVDARNRSGVSALAVAVASGCEGVDRILMEYGARQYFCAM